VNLYHLNDMHMFSDENLTVSFEEFLMGESYQKQIHDILTVLVFFFRAKPFASRLTQLIPRRRIHTAD